MLGSGAPFSEAGLQGVATVLHTCLWHLIVYLPTHSEAGSPCALVPILCTSLSPCSRVHAMHLVVASPHIHCALCPLGLAHHKDVIVLRQLRFAHLAQEDVQARRASASVAPASNVPALDAP